MEDIDVNTIQAIAAICSVLVSLVGFYFVVRQLGFAARTLVSSTHARVYEIGQAVYAKFIEDPSLRPYFYEGKPLPTGNETERHKVLATCELLCDYFEFILIERGTMDPRIHQSWRAYIDDIFRTSPAIKEFMKDRRHQYTEQMVTAFDQALARPAERVSARPPLGVAAEAH